MTEPTGALVELVDDERIVERGAMRTTWFVRQGESWTRAAEWPGAATERRDTGPGTVWERATRVTLPAGTKLMRVETRPRKETSRDPLSYLTSEIRRPPRATRRTYFRVGPGGRLHALARD